MVPTLPNPDATRRAGFTTTVVANVRNVPLERLSEHSDLSLRRVIPPAQTMKAPVATFDASL